MSKLYFTSTTKQGYRPVVSSSIMMWVVLIFCIPTSSFAEDLIIEMAKFQNDSTAQYYLGRRYLNGNGVTQNEKQAAKWFLKAAKQRHMKAQYEVGLLYKNGRGVSKDDRAAFEQFLGASEQGHPGAMFELGNYYFFGLDGSKDIAQAVIWYRKSAKQDHGAAQFHLGKILTEGMGIKVSKIEGEKWLDKARDNGVDPKFEMTSGVSLFDINLSKKANGKAVDKKVKLSSNSMVDDIRKNDVDTQYNMGMRYLNGVGGIKQPEIAAHWLREAARNEHAEAQFALGKMYMDGTGVIQSNGDAINWLSKAASWGLPLAKATLDTLIDKELASYIEEFPSGDNIKNPDDQYKVGLFYLEGKRLQRDPEKAADWIIKAARSQHPKAQYEVGMMYKDGVGIKKDLVQASYWFEKASENGNVDAIKVLAAYNSPRNFNSSQNNEQSKLDLDPLVKEAQLDDPVEQYNAGMMLLTKKGTDKDSKKGIQWLTQASNQGHIDAQKQLALIFSNGEVTDRDLPAAAAWLTKAATAGDAEAQYELGNLYKEGIGVEKNNSLAVKWYRVAARQGHPDARSILGCKIC